MNLRCVTDTARKNHCAHKVLNKRFLFVDSDFCQLACCLELCFRKKQHSDAGKQGICKDWIQS